MVSAEIGPYSELFYGGLVAWMVYFWSARGGVDEARKKRKENHHTYRELDNSWRQSNLFFVGAFLMFFAADFATLGTVIPANEQLASAFLTLGFLFLAMSIFEVVHIHRFVGNERYNPKVRLPHVIIIPELLGFQAFNLYIIFQNGVPTVFNLSNFGKVYILSVTISIFSMLFVFLRLKHMEDYVTRKDWILVGLYWLPWLVILLSGLGLF